MKHQHLVVTRYTVKGWAYDEFSPEWLEERVRVFREYCVPSMERQSADFTWLVLCDESTDPDYVEEIRAAASGISSFAVVSTSPERKIWIRQALASMVDPSADLLLTTRLDNDDALHEDALRAVQEYIEPFDHSSLSKPAGPLSPRLQVRRAKQEAVQLVLDGQSLHHLVRATRRQRR